MKKQNELTTVSGYQITCESDFYQSAHIKRDNLSGHFYQHPEEMEKLSDLLAQQEYVEILRYNSKVSEIDFEEEIDNFISTQLSKNTKINYKKSIVYFQKYCKENNLHTIKISIKNVDDYIFYLKREDYSSRTIRFYIASLSAFYDFLHRRYFDVIKINPFLKHRLPRIEDKYEKDFPTEKDVKTVCEYFSSINRPDVVCFIELLYKYGWREGIFKEMKIHEDLTWESKSKGKKKKGKITKTEYTKIMKSGLLHKNIDTIGSKVRTKTKDLFNEGKISCRFSPHDLRRERIRLTIKKEDVDKLVKVCKQWHDDVKTTIGYIESYRDR